MRLILGAARPDRIYDGAANFRVYLKPGCQANRGMVEEVIDGARRSFNKNDGLVGAF